MNNSTGDVDEDATRMQHWVSVFFMSVAALISQVLTIGGNILVLVSFKVERRLHKPSNYFLFSLAVADLIIGCFSMPVYSLYLILGYWPFGDFVCDLWISVDYACSEVSVLNLIMISVDRLWSVSSPAKYRNKMTLRRAVFMIIPAWVAPTALFFTSVFGWTLITGQEVDRSNTNQPECYLPYMEDSPVFMTVLTVLVYWVPLGVMMIMYSWIYCIILHLSKKKGRDTKKTNANVIPPKGHQGPLCVVQPIEPTIVETEAQLVTNDTTTTTTSSLSNVNGGQTYSKQPSIPGKMPDIESETEPAEDTSSSSKRHESEFSPPAVIKEDVKSSPDSKQQKTIFKFNPSKFGRTTKRRKSHKGERQSRSERKATRTLSFILGAFFITWSPYSTIVIVNAWLENEPVPLVKFYQFSYYLCYINSTINPLCYAFANELFRNTFYKILTGRSWKR